MTDVPIARRKFFRKSLVIPTEHGSWSWLLVPFLVGAAVAARTGMADRAPWLPLALTLIGGLSAFLIRQPAAAWLRIRRRRAGAADEPLAAGWTLGLALVAGACLAGLLALGRAALLWLVIPFVGVLLFYLAASRSGRAALRALWTELIGAAGLALMAPAAVIAAAGNLVPLAWVVWGLMGAQNMLGVLYVRLRLADTHGRPAKRPAVAANRPLVLGGHIAGLAAVVVTGLLGGVPLPAALPFVGFLLRAVWAVARPRPVGDVRRFGFAEVGIEVLSGACIVASFGPLWATAG
jgi:hypothetical protein